MELFLRKNKLTVKISSQIDHFYFSTFQNRLIFRVPGANFDASTKLRL